MRLNPISWGRPLQIVAGLAILLVVVMFATGAISTAWAKHIANGALRGIASTISDIDKIEGKADQLEQAVGALARQNLELEKQVAAERAKRAEITKKLDATEKANTVLNEAVNAARKKDKDRVVITTLENAVAAINRALGK